MWVGWNSVYFLPLLRIHFLELLLELTGVPIGAQKSYCWSFIETVTMIEDEYEEEKQLFDSETNMRKLMIMMIENNKAIMSMMRRRKNNVNPNEEKGEGR